MQILWWLESAATILALTNPDIYVNPISFNEEHPRVLYPDDIVTVALQFSQPVIMSCSPVVVIQLTGKTREAVYTSGNLTDMVYFNYTVRIDDHADVLEYRYSPNAFCLESGCPSSTSCTILINSEAPVQSVSRVMPSVSFSSVSSNGGWHSIAP